MMGIRLGRKNTMPTKNWSASKRNATLIINMYVESDILILFFSSDAILRELLCTLSAEVLFCLFDCEKLSWVRGYNLFLRV